MAAILEEFETLISKPIKSGSKSNAPMDDTNCDDTYLIWTWTFILTTAVLWCIARWLYFFFTAHDRSGTCCLVHHRKHSPRWGHHHPNAFVSAADRVAVMQPLFTVFNVFVWPSNLSYNKYFSGSSLVVASLCATAVALLGAAIGKRKDLLSQECYIIFVFASFLMTASEFLIFTWGLPSCSFAFQILVTAVISGISLLLLLMVIYWMCTNPRRNDQKVEDLKKAVDNLSSQITTTAVSPFTLSTAMSEVAIICDSMYGTSNIVIAINKAAKELKDDGKQSSKFRYLIDRAIGMIENSLT